MFKKMIKKKYPDRRWSVSGEAGAGKTLFASQFSKKLLVIDADHRFQEFLDLAVGEVYQLSDNPTDNISPERIKLLLKENMPGSDITDIVIDTVTAIFKPLVTEAIVSNDAGTNRNRVAAFKPKAMAMQMLADAMNAWAVNVLWLYHIYQGVDSNAKEKEATTITAVERARLRRHLNLELRVVIHPDTAKRGIFVEWARRGRSGFTIWDDSGRWTDICERIEQEVYDGLNKEQMDQIENGVPKSFASSESAIAWGFEQGCFNDAVHAKNAYDKLKLEKKPKSSAAMWALWTADVLNRKNSPIDDDEFEGDPEDQPVAELAPEPKVAEPVTEDQPAVAPSKIYQALINNYSSSLDEDSLIKMERWIIKRYTNNATPDNVREKFADLGETEINKILGVLEKSADRYLRDFTKELAEQHRVVAV